MDPEHGQGAANSCQKVVVSVEDESGGPVPNSNVDIHLDGPGTKAHFCTPEGTSQDHRAPTDGGHSPENGHPDEAKHNNNGVVHTEGETGGNGRLVIGIRSSKPGVSEITAWADVNDDDLLGQDESSALSDFQWGKGSRCTKTGTAGDDVLIGTRGTDVLCGLGGNDVIRGKGGNDRIFGGGGKDILRGDAGADLVHAGAGDDSVVGGGSRDKVFGEGGQDVISGKGSRDTLHGGSGNDDLSGGGGHDSCFGEGGNDRFRSCERQRQ
jgi:Ca2+-binding RTX toxin-like protein